MVFLSSKKIIEFLKSGSSLLSDDYFIEEAYPALYRARGHENSPSKNGTRFPGTILLYSVDYNTDYAHD